MSFIITEGLDFNQGILRFIYVLIGQINYEKLVP